MNNVIFDYKVMQCSLYEIVERNMKDEALQLDEESIGTMRDSCDEDLLACGHCEVRRGRE